MTRRSGIACLMRVIRPHMHIPGGLVRGDGLKLVENAFVARGC